MTSSRTGQGREFEGRPAAPVLNSEGLAIAAVQIPVYMPRRTVDKVKNKIVPLVIETARAISGSYFLKN